MGDNYGCVDLLVDRRKSSDFLWVSRPMDPLAPHRLPPEMKYTREQAIEAALNHPRVLFTVETLAAARGVDKAIVRREARDMLEEMASKAHLPTVRWIGLLTVKVLKRILMSFRVNQKYLLEIRQQMKHSDVQYVYVPSHRSYLDFVLMSYLLFTYEMALPNIASGMDFYKMKVVGELLRKTGAFYLRRSFSNDLLYKEIFKAYVASLVENSDRAIEFFIEGTRSRSQKSIAPKYGLLGMILEAVFQGLVPDIQFVPISITYDRPLEESLFSYELLGVPKPAETTSGLFKSLSILREQRGHGHIYFNIAPPISARKFMDYNVRRMSALSPNAKLPTDVVKNLAFEIIESHKRNTIFMPFNLIAVLFNERVHSYPHHPYSFDGLLQDYCWLKGIIKKLGATVFPKVDNGEDESYRRSEKDEIKESLNTHKNLLSFDSHNSLTLHGSYRDIKSGKIRNVRGHNLDERTMKMAVPAINLGIYVNPTFALFTKPTIAAVSVHTSDILEDYARETYILLRKLLSNEFALPTDDSTDIIANEWTHEMEFLFNAECFKSENNRITYGNNEKLRLLLSNLISPFISAVCVTCLTLYQWDNPTMEGPTDKNILKESQRLAETLLFQDDSLVRHPYTLSLDLYLSTLVSLTSYGAIKSIPNQPNYEIDRSKISTIIRDLEKILLSREVPGSYLDIGPTLIHQDDNTLQAKL
ncbi:dihydroxyacetone phosphate acyltransferase [Diachasma alloeum]|uniref:dihydroxyacetone phosphate acyltransferase n=1 Tax=Diachasma alloeum TaxID=454923 RepID=UPI00073845D8|nr:dihydroxyacetone phosphate acyltransferase [Diachasma alloeum]